MFPEKVLVFYYTGIYCASLYIFPHTFAFPEGFQDFHGVVTPLLVPLQKFPTRRWISVNNYRSTSRVIIPILPPTHIYSSDISHFITFVGLVSAHLTRFHREIAWYHGTGNTVVITIRVSLFDPIHAVCL